MIKRFLVKVRHVPIEDASPYLVDIEGVMFSDGFIVIHGSFFRGNFVTSLDELERMIPHSEIKWIDKEEAQQAMATAGLPPGVPGTPVLPGQVYPPPAPAPGQPAGAQPGQAPPQGGKL